MTNSHNRFTVRFWGVRGSIACPGSGTVRYGGNTSCVEMRVGSQLLIFDGGTGLRVLGQALLPEMPIKAAHLFFTHSHWDHIQGFPFFVPAFVKGNCFHIYGAIAPNGSTIEQRLTDQMLHPNFPVPLQVMGADLKFHDLEVGDDVPLADITVETALLNHPGEAIGYRVNWQDHAVAYITDTEHFDDRLDDNVLHLAREADLLIYDATYTDEEYHNPKSSKRGWGHSTWQEAVKIARAAQVKKLVIFHHDPLHDDDFMDRVREDTARQFPNSVVAWEGLTIDLVDQHSVPAYRPLVEQYSEAEVSA